MHNASANICIHTFGGHKCSFFHGYISRSAVSGHGEFMFNVEEIAKLFSKVAVSFHFLTSNI